MFSSLINWFQNADWYTLIDTAVVFAVGRYLPSAMPVVDSVRTFLSKWFSPKK